MKFLHLEITCCAECPYNYYHEYDDVGTSFGMDYYCDKIGYCNPITKQDTEAGVRENCPLSDSEEGQ